MNSMCRNYHQMYAFGKKKAIKKLSSSKSTSEETLSGNMLWQMAVWHRWQEVKLPRHRLFVLLFLSLLFFFVFYFFLWNHDADRGQLPSRLGPNYARMGFDGFITPYKICKSSGFTSMQYDFYLNNGVHEPKVIFWSEGSHIWRVLCWLYWHIPIMAEN